jgi:mannose/fructose-specific phosphotransferase system component IIA
LEKKPWIFILTHGRVGEELVNSAQMILGPLKDVYTFPLLTGMSPEEYREQIVKVMDMAPEGSIIMTDLFGGTTSNIAALLSQKYRVSAVSGVNMAMLIEADLLRNSCVGEELANALIAVGKDSLKNIVRTLEERKNSRLVQGG